MAGNEREILDFYQIPNLYPTEWPAEKDEDASADEDENGAGRRQSRYQALESAVRDRKSLAAGAEGGNLVLKDELDPLGTSDSIVASLADMGVPVQDDVRLRNRFLLSSTSFSPSLYLSTMHANSDRQTLERGLEVLSQSIDQKSASLKVLVESNVEKFVKAKATIDNVYKEMKSRGVDSGQPRGGRHSRHASRSAVRQGAADGPSNPLASPLSDSRKKNALVKESEYGLLGIKAPLIDVSAKAEEVWRPALGGRDKVAQLKAFRGYLDEFHEYFELSYLVAESIKRKDNDSLVGLYNRAKKFADDTRRMASELGERKPSDSQLFQIVLAGRICYDVDLRIRDYRQELMKMLESKPTIPKPDGRSVGTDDRHMKTITMLLELGHDENPISKWLETRCKQLRNELLEAADRPKALIEQQRRILAGKDKPSPQDVASHLRSLGRSTVEGKLPSPDSDDVVELWEQILRFLTRLLSPSDGFLGRLVEFWQLAEGFIDSKTQRMLPLGYNGESRRHHQLSQQTVTKLAQDVAELVELVRDHLYSFFASPPPEDISPQLLSPNSPASASALTPTALRDPRVNADPGSPLPPSPRRGESWETLAFWPPWSNSVSGSHYLSQMMALVGSGASVMASIGPVAAEDARLLEGLRSLVGVARERLVVALCAAWNNDAENIKHVEDWHRPTDSRDVTRMPAVFSAFQGALLKGMQRILYVPDAMDKPGAESIVPAPPPAQVKKVHGQYVATLYKALSGMVENAERPVTAGEDDGTAAQDHAQGAELMALTAGKTWLDVGDRNGRMLLTLSNLQVLRSQIVPQLNSQFESAFAANLTDDAKKIRDVLGQIDARLFQSYTRPTVDRLGALVQAGLCAPDWVPAPGQRPQSAKAYVYEALLALVEVHAQLSTTAPSLTAQVLSYLLEQASVQLLEAFRRRPRYSLEALMQATLDVEFVAQTLSHYMTDGASELQGQIYQELDGRTDNDARARLQGELPEMRSVLKRLREASRSEFACFKKPKRHGQGARAEATTSGAG